MALTKCHGESTLQIPKNGRKRRQTWLKWSVESSPPAGIGNWNLSLCEINHLCLKPIVSQNCETYFNFLESNNFRETKFLMTFYCTHFLTLHKHQKLPMQCWSCWSTSSRCERWSRAFRWPQWSQKWAPPGPLCWLAHTSPSLRVRLFIDLFIYFLNIVYFLIFLTFILIFLYFY